MLLKWRDVNKVTPRGVIVASDERQEWLLPWWFENYAKHNTFPITFIDLGLSPEGKEFCIERGELVSIPDYSALGLKEETDPEKALFWERTYGTRSWWSKRECWHKKPIALLQTPYEHTLWLDTDCEVRGNLDPVFDIVATSGAIVICEETEETQAFDREQGNIFPDEILFNSGVIGFVRGSAYIMEWAGATLSKHGSYWGDQDLLSRLIYENKWPVQILDPMYNWRELAKGKHPDVKISHWLGEKGKFFISMKQLGFLD